MKSILYKISLGFSVIIPVLAATIALKPQWRESVRDYLSPDYRKPLSTTYGNVLGDGSVSQIVKIKTRDNLYVEIYRPTGTGSRELVYRIELGQSKDGYFTLQGQLTNLAVTDLDGDHIGEIIAPGYDQNLTAHLNVYHYDRGTKVFSRVHGDTEFPPMSNL
jgi:hypothetical protein